MILFIKGIPPFTSDPIDVPELLVDVPNYGPGTVVGWYHEGDRPWLVGWWIVELLAPPACLIVPTSIGMPIRMLCFPPELRAA